MEFLFVAGFSEQITSDGISLALREYEGFKLNEVEILNRGNYALTQLRIYDPLVDLPTTQELLAGCGILGWKEFEDLQLALSFRRVLARSMRAVAAAGIISEVNVFPKDYFNKPHTP